MLRLVIYAGWQTTGERKPVLTTFILSLFKLPTMKSLFLILLIILVIACTGCLQTTTPASELTAVPPVTTPMTPVMTPNSTTQMQINMSAWQTGPNVYVQYNGGANAADLTSLNIRIISYSGNVESRTINAPVPNTTWQFTYATSNSANRVNIVGTFSNGRQQTVLFKYL